MEKIETHKMSFDFLKPFLGLDFPRNEALQMVRASWKYFHEKPRGADPGGRGAEVFLNSFIF